MLNYKVEYLEVLELRESKAEGLGRGNGRLKINAVLVLTQLDELHQHARGVSRGHQLRY